MIKTPLPRLAGAADPLKERLHLPQAFKYPQFRNYWLGLLASVTGYQMLVMFSLGWLISNELNADVRFLGYMSSAIAVPAIGLNLFGGVFADKLNPKRLLLLTQLTTALVVFGLGLLVVLDVANEWHVLVAAFLIGAVQAFDNPTRQSLFLRLVDRTAFSSAVVLNASVWTGTRIFAPFIAGVIIGRTDTSVAIFVSAAGFLAFALISQSLRPIPVQRASGRVLTEMMAGFLFIRRSPVFSILIGTTFFTSFFGLSYVFLMPVFADDVFEVGAEKIGFLMGAAGVGALMGIFIASMRTRSPKKGWFLIGGALGFGFFLMLFALASNSQQYELSLVLLFAADMCISIYFIMVMTTLQAQVPDQFRGRVMGFYAITWSLAPLGGLQSSQIAHHASAPVAVAIGGALMFVMALSVALGSRHVRSIGRASEEGSPG